MLKYVVVTTIWSAKGQSPALEDPLFHLYELAQRKAKDTDEAAGLFLAIDQARDWLCKFDSMSQQAWLLILQLMNRADAGSVIAVYLFIRTDPGQELGCIITVIEGKDFDIQAEVSRIASMWEAVATSSELRASVFLLEVRFLPRGSGSFEQYAAGISHN